MKPEPAKISYNGQATRDYDTSSLDESVASGQTRPQYQSCKNQVLFRRRTRSNEDAIELQTKVLRNGLNIVRIGVQGNVRLHFTQIYSDAAVVWCIVVSSEVDRLRLVYSLPTPLDESSDDVVGLEDASDCA